MMPGAGAAVRGPGADWTAPGERSCLRCLHVTCFILIAGPS